MPDNFEVITTTDKSKRDEMYRDLKANGNRLERMAVKFSSSEPLHMIDPIVYNRDGSRRPALDRDMPRRIVKEFSSDDIKTRKSSVQLRPRFQSTWSVAYPRN